MITLASGWGLSAIAQQAVTLYVSTFGEFVPNGGGPPAAQVMSQVGVTNAWTGLLPGGGTVPAGQQALIHQIAILNTNGTIENIAVNAIQPGGAQANISAAPYITVPGSNGMAFYGRNGWTVVNGAGVPLASLSKLGIGASGLFGYKVQFGQVVASFAAGSPATYDVTLPTAWPNSHTAFVASVWPMTTWAGVGASFAGPNGATTGNPTLGTGGVMIMNTNAQNFRVNWISIGN